MEGEGTAVRDKGRIAREGRPGDRRRERRGGEVAGRCELMMQYGADFAAVLGVGWRGWRRSVLDNRRLLVTAPRDREIVMVEAEQDRLEQNGEETEPRRAARPSRVADYRFSRPAHHRARIASPRQNRKRFT